jgi:hypothetical protein
LEVLTVATPEIHKQRIRRETIGEIVDLMVRYGITHEDISDYKGITKAEQLHQHRERANRIKQHAENLEKARQAKAAKKEVK